MVFLYECLDSLFELKWEGRMLSQRYKGLLTCGVIFLFISFVSSAVLGSALIAYGVSGGDKKPRTIEYAINTKTPAQADTIINIKDGVRDTTYTYKFTEAI